MRSEPAVWATVRCRETTKVHGCAIDPERFLHDWVRATGHCVILCSYKDIFHNQDCGEEHWKAKYGDQ